MSNIIKAFINISNNHQKDIETITQGNNRANNMGEGLENYIKNAFLDSKELDNLEALAKVFSYQNSSYPKAKLYANSPMITNACKACEAWDIKDMLYAVGYVKQKQLKSLWLVYGDCFCVEFTQTKELGKVKKVDPLGITDLRIRGMWHIENPNKTFDYLYNYDESKAFQLMALMTKDKYESMPKSDREMVESMECVEVKWLMGFLLGLK